MVHFPLRWFAPAALCAAAWVASAQTATPSARPDPLDPNAKVPALVLDSSLARHRRLGDDKAVPWREANDRVSAIGGWRAYAREAQAVQPAASSSPAGGTKTP